MSPFDWTIAALTALSVVLIPLLVIAFRGAIKWTKVEDKLDHVVGNMSELVEGKDRVHAELVAQMAANSESEKRTHTEILEQMRLDRDATDRRLRFMEEWFINSGMQQMAKGRSAT